VNELYYMGVQDTREKLGIANADGLDLALNNIKTVSLVDTHPHRCFCFRSVQL
jgi:hypothetical protein